MLGETLTGSSWYFLVNLLKFSRPGVDDGHEQQAEGGRLEATEEAPAGHEGKFNCTSYLFWQNLVSSVQSSRRLKLLTNHFLSFFGIETQQHI